MFWGSKYEPMVVPMISFAPPILAVATHQPLGSLESQYELSKLLENPAHRLKHEEVGSHCCDPALRNQEGMNLSKSDMAIKAIGWESPSAVSEMWRLIGISHPMIIIILVTGGEKWIMLY